MHELTKSKKVVDDHFQIQKDNQIFDKVCELTEICNDEYEDVKQARYINN